MFNSPRDGVANLAIDDQFDTTKTTVGYLSDGCHYPVVANGGEGADSFVVLRNLAVVDLNGGDGPDTFLIRAFALYDQDVGEEVDPALETTTVSGGDGDDFVEYTINAPVDIDGGPGLDRIIVVGTEANDRFVITRNGNLQKLTAPFFLLFFYFAGIFGAGVFVIFTNIETIELNTIEGNDLITILSTDPTLITTIYAGKGSDIIAITPENPQTIVANDLRGHSGLIDHIVSSSGSYNALTVDGVAVNVADADGPEVVVTENQADNILYEGTSGTFSYDVVLTQDPLVGQVEITTVISGSDIDGALNGEANPSVLIFDTNNWATPQTVVVSALSDAALENETSLIALMGVVHTNGDRYSETSVRPVIFRIVDNDKPAFTTIESDGETVVIEGGATDTYSLELIPCSGSGTVDVNFDSSKVTVTPSSWSYTSSNCQQTFTVTAVDDSIVESFHYTDITHTVSSASDSDLLGDFGSINVKIADNDYPGVLVTETLGFTDVIEGGATDTYTVVLTAAPQVGEVVTIDVTPVATLTAAGTSVQVGVSPSVINFDSNNWNTPVTVTVSGLVDNVFDGNEFQAFATQPSQSQAIQGPLFISGDENPSGITNIPDPYTLPEETDLEVFPDDNPFQANFEVDEELQVDRLVVYDIDNVRDDTLDIWNDRVIGLGMGPDRVFDGITINGSITFSEMETVDIYLSSQAIDTVTIDSEGDAATNVYVETAGGNDVINVLSISGHTTIDAGDGNDVFTIGEANDLGKINALLTVIGGSGTDDVTLENEAESSDLTSYLSRTTFTGIGMDERTDVTLDFVQTVTVEATSGTFDLSFIYENATYGPFTFNYGATADEITTAFETALFTVNDTCGLLGRSDCAPSVNVLKVDNTYLIRFEGELTSTIGRGISLVTLDGSNLVGFVSEFVSTSNIDVIQRTDGLNYYQVETFTVHAGSGTDVVNVRGTASETIFNLNSGDDAIYISSDADLNTTTARTLEYLEGHLDYIEADLTINAGDGRHIMMISDEATPFSKGTPASPAQLSNSALTGVAVGDITYTSSSNHTFADGITIWLGEQNDVINVVSTHKREGKRKNKILVFFFNSFHLFQVLERPLPSILETEMIKLMFLLILLPMASLFSIRKKVMILLMLPTLPFLSLSLVVLETMSYLEVLERI